MKTLPPHIVALYPPGSIVVDDDGDRHVVEGATPSAPTAAPEASAASLLRPGDVLSLIIHKCGFTPSCNCGCDEMQARMNAWGWLGCWRHRAELVDWLVTKAAEVGITVERKTVPALIATAIQEYRRSRRRGDPGAGSTPR